MVDQPQGDSDADFEVARRAVDLGWLTREQVEVALLEVELVPDSRLLSHLPLTPDQIRQLEAPIPALPPEVAQAASDPGRRVAQYILAEHHRAGGMGKVVKAWDTRLSRWVALKFLNKVGKERLRANFEEEARLAAGLAHPGIAAIYEIGAHDGAPFIAMQYIDGRTLAEARRDLSPRQAARVVRDAAQAVAFAHDRGVIHRDLKPSNVMLDGSGRVYVTDFGLAARTEALEASRTFSGTPEYISPEQARGGEADARTDVHGLGATLYDLLTGRPPNPGNGVVEILGRLEVSDRVPPRTLNREIEADLETIVLKCLDRNPSLRYATARDLAEDLERFLNRDAIAARRASPLYRIRRGVAKRKAWVAAAVATAVLAGALGWWLVRGRPERDHLRHFNAGMQAWQDLGPKTYGEVNREALKALAARARESFERANEAVESAEAHVMRGRCLLIEQRRREGLQAFERALVVEPSSAAARLELAKALLLDYQSARGTPHVVRPAGEPDVFGRQVPENEKSRRLRERAEALLSKGPVPPDRVDLLKGLAAMGRGSYEEAAVHLERHSRLDPLDSQAIRLWGESLLFSRRFEEALHAVQRSLALVRDKAGFWMSAIIRAQLKDVEGAWRDLDQALRQDPNDAETFYVRGNVRASVRDFAGAIKEFEEAIRLNPRFTWAFINCGLSRLEVKDCAGAARDLEKAVGLNPKDAQAILNLGLARAGLLDYEGAIEAYDKAIGLDPKEPVAYFNRGAALYNLGARQKSVDLMERAAVDMIAAIDLSPAGARLRRNFAESLHKVCHRLHDAKRYQRSIEGNRKAVEVLGNTVIGIGSAYDAACGHALLGENSNALVWLEKAVEMGWKDVAHIERDSDLDSLRGEERYKKLVARLKADY